MLGPIQLKNNRNFKNIIQNFLTAGIILIILFNSNVIIFGDTTPIIKPSWNDGSWWIIEVWQAAVNQPVSNPPWRKINELKLELKQGRHEFKNNDWSIVVTDINQQWVGSEIDKIEVYYDKSFTILGAKGFNSKKKNAVTISATGDYWSFTNYQKGFFTIPNYIHKWSMITENTGLSAQEGKVVKVIIDSKDNEFQHWRGNKPWWVYYQCSSPPIKCKSTKWFDKGKK